MRSLKGSLAMSADSKTKPVRVRGDLVPMLKIIEAAAEMQGKGFKLWDYFDKLVRPTILADYKKALAVIAKNTPQS